MFLKELLLRTYQNLAVLQEREAKAGGEARLELLNQIEDHQHAIELIQQTLTAPTTELTLRQLKAELRPLLIATNVEEIDLEALKLETPLRPFEPETLLIPAGPFMLGSDDGPLEEKPAHEVTLPDFRLGKFPVTVAQYAEFIKQVKLQELPNMKGWSLLREPPAAKLDHPVVGVSWPEAEAYCQWLSQQTGRVYRLPYEPEWEKAASWAGEHQRPYPWGDEFNPNHCNGKGASREETSPVGTYSPQGDSPYGCADMAGNVQEWTRSLWGDAPQPCAFLYPYQAEDGRESLAADQQQRYRVVRGGSFRDEPARLRCSARVGASPSSRNSWRGFRVVLEI
jgi:formylglycine-generating enzyme required for sulfatase activity